MYLSNEAEECKHKTKTICMSRNSRNVSNENKQGMFFLAKACLKIGFGVGILKI